MFTLNEDTYSKTIVISKMQVTYNKFIEDSEPDTVGEVRSHASYSGLIQISQ